VCIEKQKRRRLTRFSFFSRLSLNLSVYTTIDTWYKNITGTTVNQIQSQDFMFYSRIYITINVQGVNTAHRKVMPQKAQLWFS